MTVLDIINKVLRRLREPEVSAPTETSYSELIADFLVDIHGELLMHEWSSMEHTIDVPVDASQRTLDLSRLEATGDVASSSRLPTTDSVVLWAKCFRNSTDPLGMPVGLSSLPAIEAAYQMDRSSTSDYITNIGFRNHPDRDGLEAVVWPTPTVAQHLRARLWTPESPIVPDTDSSRTVLIPSRPLYLGTLYLALNERGEELGEPGGVAERRYNDAVTIALEADMNRRSHADQYFAERV